MSIFLKISLTRTLDYHKDILIDVPLLGIHSKLDSYYFLLDRNIIFYSTGYKKVTEVLIHILQEWKKKIINLKVVDYLPLDFSDQYIGCFKLELLNKESIKVTYGFTQKIMGMDIFPSNVQHFVIRDEDFETDSKTVIVSVSDLLKAIDNSCQLLANQSMSFKDS